MRAILVFNNINDLIFWRWDSLFIKHVLVLAKVQGLLPNDSDLQREYVGELNPDVVIQIFAPIITSQRIMNYQFGNSYSSVQCKDGINIVFDEYVGYLFIHISKESTYWMQRSIGICISVVKYFCGPDVSLLKHDRQKAGVHMALESWDKLSLRDQAILVGASERISSGTEAVTSIMAALKAVANTLPSPTTPSHVALFVRNKLVSLYSIRGADDLSTADIIFLGVMSAAAQDKWSRKPPSDINNPESPSDDECDEQPYNGEDEGQTLSWTVLLNNGIPNVIHLHRLSKNITLLLAVGLTSNAAGSVSAALHAISAITTPLAQRDIETLKQSFTSLDVAMKKALEALKKTKNQSESPQKKLQLQWEVNRRQFTDFIKDNVGSWAALESAVSSMTVGMRTYLHLACRGFIPPDIHINPIASQAHSKLAHMYQFLRVKSLGNFTLALSPVMSRYVEEFPGLVHFLHIDRTHHRLIAPTLPHCSTTLPREKIWAMFERTRANLQEGHLASMWKDGSLHYAHLVWFEDGGGPSIKPCPLTSQALRKLPPPNIFPDDFYLKLSEACFPNASRPVQCWELIAVHIGLLPAGTALAHIRRLAATVSDINEHPHPVNLL